MTTVFELIDMRSFSSLWYWIALAVVWSTASHYVLGVPFDMVARAARRGGQDQADLEALVRIKSMRLLGGAGTAGTLLIALGSMLLTGLFLLGFSYGVEFAQAIFLIFFPLSFVLLLSLSTARRVASGGLDAAGLRRTLGRHRFWVQVIGVLSIFVTAMWGMYQNMNLGPLGG